MKKIYPGINIQYPFSQLILIKSKKVETREYPLPAHLVNVELALIETPGDGNVFKARIIGTIKFSESFKYESMASFRNDFERHLVEPASKFDWKTKPKWGWVVSYVKPLKRPILAPKNKGICFTKEISL